jgi:hypothetical protein
MTLEFLSVRVVAVPPGEAPLWVREQWVGLELPLARRARASTLPTVGALSGPKSIVGQCFAFLSGRTARETGYVVRVVDALAVLEKSSPEAAHWWLTHASHLVSRNRLFVFQENVCEPSTVAIGV